MKQKKKVKISVGSLVEFTSGQDIKRSFFSPERAVEGIKGHVEIQQSIKNTLPADIKYHSEVSVSKSVESSLICLEISGRIDGVIEHSRGRTIHEIKTLKLKPEDIEAPFEKHMAQAKCYAFMYGNNNNLQSMGIKLSYYNMDTQEENAFEFNYGMDELDTFFYRLAGSYMDRLEMLENWYNIRDASIEKLDFPYPEFRRGQDEMISSVYNSIESGERLFVQAPTGIGKTVASIFPAVKCLGEGHTSKIFYLTAKNTTKALAEKTLEDLRKSGLCLKSLTITAKETICPNRENYCDSMTCSYMDNYSIKFASVMEKVLDFNSISRKELEKYASMHEICPFELSLDLSYFCDMLICDYNYLFDPRVFLKRFFMYKKKTDYCFLIDEAHNLVDRSREMFSALISLKQFRELSSELKGFIPMLYKKTYVICLFLKQILDRLAANYGHNTTGSFHAEKNFPEGLIPLMKEFVEITESFLENESYLSQKEDFMKVYYDTCFFIKISDTYDEKYVTFYDFNRSNLKIKLMCIDPSHILDTAMNRGKSSILFSATLSPIEYFSRVLGGGHDVGTLMLQSPFFRENMAVYIDDSISTRYKMRHRSYKPIAECINTVVSSKTGNYMVFFPSYRYMQDVLALFHTMNTGARIIIQSPGMKDTQREFFLNQFAETGETSLIAFAVMGGIFGESIDLTGEKLSGVIIVGVGLPQLCPERNIIKQYYDSIYGTGFEYSYVYPGINKVLQASGRVIRTQTDTGVIVLLDERFSTYAYRELLPSEWHPISRASENDNLEDILDEFWQI